MHAEQPGEGPEHRAAAHGWALNSAMPDSSPNCCLVVVKVRQVSQPLTVSSPSVTMGMITKEPQ